MSRRVLLALCTTLLVSGCTSISANHEHNGELRGAAAAMAALGNLPCSDFPPDKPNHRSCVAEADALQKSARNRLLLARIDEYAKQGRSGSHAGPMWFDLYDSYRSVGPDADTMDRRTAEALSVLSLVAVLPAPDLWPAMRVEAYRRAQSSNDDADAHVTALGVSLLFDTLLNDLKAQARTLGKLQSAVSKATPARREQAQPLIAEWRRHLAIETGRYDPARELLQGIDSRGAAETRFFRIPPLVTQLGEQRARMLLEKILFEKPIEFWFSGDDGTQALAQQIALAHPERLATVQWNLVAGNRALELLHAMTILDCRRRPCASSPASLDTALERAPRRVRHALLQPLIESGDVEHAKRIVLEATDNDMAAYGLTGVLQEMISGGDGESGLAFMQKLLSSPAALPYWSSLRAFAYATDQRYAGRAYELLRQAPATAPDLEETRTLLSSSIIVTDGEFEDPVSIAARLQKRLRLTVATALSTSYQDDPRFGKADAAMQLADLGLLEARADWLEQGLAATQPILDKTRTQAYAADDYNGLFARNRALEYFVRISVQSSRLIEAETLLFRELAAIGARCRTMDHRGCNDQFASGYSGKDYNTAATLLAKLYAHANSDADVRLLVDSYPFWHSTDAAGLSFQDECGCMGQPGADVAFAQSLLSSGNRDAALGLLQTRLGTEYMATPGQANLYGKIARAHVVDGLESNYSLPRGERLAIASLAAHGAGKSVQATQLAMHARREGLYRPWRLALARMSTDSAADAGDTKTSERWRHSVKALEIAGQADRYKSVGATVKARQLFDQALARAQSGDCIEASMLDLAHQQGDRAWATDLVRQMATRVRQDASGAAVGCLRGYLELHTSERAILRSELLKDPETRPRYLAEQLPALLYALDDNCRARKSGDKAACIAALNTNAHAAYENLKHQLRGRPDDVDVLARLAGFVQRSDFPSLYAGHMDGPPSPPAIAVSAEERDEWVLRRIALDPRALPDGIARTGSDFREHWSSVIHLEKLWRAARDGGKISEKLPVPVSYPLVAANQYQRRDQSNADHRISTAADRAGNAVASTEVVQMAVRFIEPGTHDPCTMCL